VTQLVLVASQKEQGDNLSPIDRLNAKADRIAQSGENLKKIVEAAEPLCASLGDAQKHKSSRLDVCWCPSADALRWR
jgi:hypothetical protein